MLTNALFNAAASALRPLVLGSVLGTSAAARKNALSNILGQTRGLLWSVEREKGHTYRDTKDIINETEIQE